MKRSTLTTPIYLKTGLQDGLREGEPCYYVLTRSGLFIGRNTEFFQSLVPARRWPAELADQSAHLRLRYPQVTADVLGPVMGFFRRVALEHGAEAMALLVLDRRRRRLVPLVPTQVGTVGRTWSGASYPIGLHYQSPRLDAARHLVIGDIHSHASEAAYASSIDVADESFRTGLHVVAGRVDRPSPQWHVEYVVDGTRFSVQPETILDLEGYAESPRPFPSRWLDRLRVATGWGYHQAATGSGS